MTEEMFDAGSDEGEFDESESPAQETDWKAESRKWEQRAKDNMAQINSLKPKAELFEELEQASKTDLERMNDELARSQSDAEKWRTASVSSRIEALAATEFADPSDAVTALSADPSRYIDLDGTFNDGAIRADLNSVLERKPHWRKTDPATSGPRAPVPNPAQGRGKAPSSDPAAEFASVIKRQLSGA